MRPQDLNLLMVFDAIMTEKSITRAADRLSMTQPAVSNSVSRMRTAWKDEVFVKDGRNIQPTIYAQNLWEKIKLPLSSLSDAVDPKVFDPATARRTFRIASADIVADTAWAHLRKIIEQEAPHINIHAIPYTIVNADKVLDDAEVDLVIGDASGTSSTFRSEFLFTPSFLCVMRLGHPLAKQKLGLHEFANADHLLVSLSGDTTGVTDQVLMQHGLSRRVALTVNHFSSVAKLVQNSNLICVVPTAAVYEAILDEKIAATRPPIDIPPNQISMIWHKRQDRDEGLAWLRQHLKQIIVSNTKNNTKATMLKLCKSNPQICSAAEQDSHIDNVRPITLNTAI
ncbi:LysR family transcriptional regulator [Aliiglaciecola sp. LCG003]|uniref:LysR family transcriptional regulator n=1 Tax=Aliiglaciecola sp. LCG003 TaxID=3053655 RepID=UPI002572B250|nr:LysR family transcriptional regulator [Aliiglaciecola sp. LCG003]WJG08815.1 LysR family transcriptional regulator [Aliiglaciecola sp. LCG003]